MKPAPRVLMLGTALDGRGGIASMVCGLRAAGLFERESVRYLASHSEGPWWRKACAAQFSLWHTVFACLASRPAVVHAHSASYASFYRKSLLLLVARRAACKTILHVHGGGFARFAGAGSGPLARWWIRHTLEASSVVIALSETWACFLRDYAPRARVVVVPNCVVVGAAATRPAQPGRILFLGRAQAAKGVYELLAALAVLAPAHPQLRLVIGGDGALPALRQRAAELGVADRLELPGWLDGPARRRELERAAIFCLPSHAEGLPLALLEAMADAKAVVATNVGAIPELVCDHVNGVLVPAGDVAALGAALASLLDDAALRETLGRCARATIVARYSGERALAQLSALYRELAGEAR
ncbi:MAG: glycosyltransferase [Pseudomonadota bacterium]